MKKLILIICLTAISICCKAQNAIHSSEITINGIQFFGNNVSLVTQHFGQPNSIEDYFFEMDDVMSQKYIYNGILFYIVNSKVNSFEITGNNYAFTSNNIKVGNNINSLQSIYPNSFSNKKSDALIIRFNNIDRFICLLYTSDAADE